jgi:hypothetical protein
MAEVFLADFAHVADGEVVAIGSRSVERALHAAAWFRGDLGNESE